MAFVQPFRYTLLLWAAALGWLCFGETPDVPTIVGSVILVGAGYLNVRLEQRRAADEAKHTHAAEGTSFANQASPKCRWVQPAAEVVLL